MEAARAKSQRDRPLGVLNGGTWVPGVGDVSTPSIQIVRDGVSELGTNDYGRLKGSAG